MIDKQKVKAYRAAVAAALESVNEQFGMVNNATTARITYSDNDISFKLTSTVLPSDEDNNTDSNMPHAKDLPLGTIALWRANCSRFGLPEDALGKFVHLSGRTMRIIGIKPNAKKNCVIIQGERGGEWITDAPAINRALEKA